MLHKAKCGTPFRILGIVFAAAMLLIYLSGLVIGWRAKALRLPFIATLAIGTAITATLLFMSL